MDTTLRYHVQRQNEDGTWTSLGGFREEVDSRQWLETESARTEMLRIQDLETDQTIETLAEA